MVTVVVAICRNVSQPVATAALNTNIKVTAAFGTIVAIVATVAAATGKTKSTIEPDDPHRVVQVGRAFACGEIRNNVNVRLGYSFHAIPAHVRIDLAL